MPHHLLRDHARDLRRNQTSTERRLWGQLRGHRLGGWKWRRQTPIGPYIVDFYCPAARLVIELDGPTHQEQGFYDERRTEYLQRGGLRVLRFPAEQVCDGGMDYLCDCILAACRGAAA